MTLLLYLKKKANISNEYKNVVVDAQYTLQYCDVTNTVLRHNNIVKLYFSEALFLWRNTSCSKAVDDCRL